MLCVELKCECWFLWRVEGLMCLMMLLSRSLWAVAYVRIKLADNWASHVGYTDVKTFVKGFHDICSERIVCTPHLDQADLLCSGVILCHRIQFKYKIHFNSFLKHSSNPKHCIPTLSSGVRTLNPVPWCCLLLFAVVMTSACGRAEYNTGKECCPMCSPGKLHIWKKVVQCRVFQ